MGAEIYFIPICSYIKVLSSLWKLFDNFFYLWRPPSFRPRKAAWLHGSFKWHGRAIFLPGQVGLSVNRMWLCWLPSAHALACEVVKRADEACFADKLDSSFSRSRSSSMSSLENITSEAVQCLAFADSYTKKSGQYDTMLAINFLLLTIM